MLRHSKDRFDGKLDSTGHIFWFEYPEGKNRGENEPDLGQYDAKTELVSCDFACAIFRKTLFDRIGMLDESMFMYHEDIDFCVRARISGWRVIYCPNTLVYHWRGGSTTDVKKLKLWELRRRHLLRLALKDYQARNILRVLLYQGRQGIVAVIETSAGLLNRDLRYSALKLRKIPIMLDAIFWNIINFPMNERLQVQVTRKLADSEVFKREARRGALDPLIG